MLPGDKNINNFSSSLDINNVNKETLKTFDLPINSSNVSSFQPPSDSLKTGKIHQEEHHVDDFFLQIDQRIKNLEDNLMILQNSVLLTTFVNEGFMKKISSQFGGKK